MNPFNLRPIRFEAIIEKLAPLFGEGSFAEAFSKITQKLKTCDYYFCENTDSFILADKAGASHILIVRSKNDLAKYAYLARTQNVSSELINRIETGRMIPFWGTFENFESAKAADWIFNTYSAKKIENGKDYYYALIGPKKTAALLGISVVNHG